MAVTSGQGQTPGPWLCAGCGKPSPDMLRNCDCPTGALFRKGEPGGVGKIDPGSKEDWERRARCAEALLMTHGIQMTEEAARLAREALSQGSPVSIRERRLIEALKSARLQIDYLHGKFTETGSGNAVLAQIDAALKSTTQEDGEP